MSSSRSDLDLRLVPATVAMLVAAWCATADTSWGTWAWPALAGLCVLTVLLAVALRRRPGGPRTRGAVGALPGVAVCLVLAAVPFFFVTVTADVRDPAALGGVDTADVQGTVVGAPQPGRFGGIEFTAVVSRVGDLAGLQVPVLVVAAETSDVRADDLRIGAGFVAVARIDPIGQPGRERYRVAFLGRPAHVTGPPWWLAWADHLRTGLRSAASGYPQPGASLIPGLATGDDGGVAADLDTAMTASGLTHLTAVSGANCAIVIAATAAVVARLRGRRIIRVGVCLVVLALFVVLVTPTPSVARAAVMCALVLIAQAWGRSARGAPLLCLAVLMLLLLDPWLVREYGFALSVAATAGLLFSGPPIARALERILPTWLAAAIAVPTAAQLWCQPILITLQPGISLVSIPANLLAGPAAPAATTLGLFACVVGALIPPLAVAVTGLVWVPAAWIAGVATFFGRPGAGLPWPSEGWGVVASGLVGVAVMLTVAARSSRVRRTTAAALTVTIVGVAGCWGGGVLVGVLSRPSDWDIAACDVGQGDAVLVRSGGLTALVDTGPAPTALTGCLDSLSVSTIDLLVLTHYDLDHVGGLDAVLGRIGTALVGPPGDSGDEAVIDRLSARGARIVHAVAPLSGALGELGWRVLWPRAADPRTGNSASVTVEFCGAYCALFLGDLGREAQRSLLPSIRDADIVKVAHHGSADQFPALYDRAAAEVALVTVGVGNTYGHPTARTLTMLADDRSAILRTDRQGMVLLSRSGDGWQVWSERR